MPIVTAVDDSERDQRTVAEGAALARAFGDELHVVHVRDREDLEEAADADVGDERSAAQAAADVAADVASAVTDEFTPVGRIGRPVTEIENYVEDVDARYLVLGGRKRSPLGKALFGSVTQSLLLSVDRPIVTVRAVEGED